MFRRIYVFIATLLFCSNVYAFDKINDNKLILLTSSEHHSLPEQADSITRQRAEMACNLLNKKLVTFSYKELDVEILPQDCNKTFKPSECLVDVLTLDKVKIPTNGTLLPVSKEDVEYRWHKGAATVTILTLAFIPVVVVYKSRIATDIQCAEQEEMKFTTN